MESSIETAGSSQWWERGVIYQVYPRSFQDSNGDGIGDLEGVRKRLDYIASLGVDAVWLSPIFPSPMADFGYDVADYCDIDPMFGDLTAFDALLADAHAKGLKVLLDFVPNHTSIEHPWFRESRLSRDNPKRDWYIWANPAQDGGPPNNWTSDMGGSSWELDAATNQFYLHAFLKEQADLNWRNFEVREAMTDVLRFWFDRGVDGFRIDVLWHCFKAENYPDNPLNPDWIPMQGEKLKVLQQHSANQPEIHQLGSDFRALADSYGQRLLVGEICLPVPQLMTYYGTDTAPGVHLPFNFQLLDVEWESSALGRMIEEYEAALPPGGWPNWVMGSHDAPRIAGRLGEAQARVAAMLLLTLRGTPTLYQGDEIGIGKVIIPPDRVCDPQDLRQPGLGLGRDPSRTPMAWNASQYGGFSNVDPWLPLHHDWQLRNVSHQEINDNSMLLLYQRLLALRREHDALSVGSFTLLHAEEGVLVYRRSQAEKLVIALNLEDKIKSADWLGEARLLLSTVGADAFTGTLAANEGVILDVAAN